MSRYRKYFFIRSVLTSSHAFLLMNRKRHKQAYRDAINLFARELIML